MLPAGASFSGFYYAALDIEERRLEALYYHHDTERYVCGWQGWVFGCLTEGSLPQSSVSLAMSVLLCFWLLASRGLRPGAHWHKQPRKPTFDRL